MKTFGVEGSGESFVVPIELAGSTTLPEEMTTVLGIGINTVATGGAGGSPERTSTDPTEGLMEAFSDTTSFVIIKSGILVAEEVAGAYAFKSIRFIGSPYG